MDGPSFQDNAEDSTKRPDLEELVTSKYYELRPLVEQATHLDPETTELFLRASRMEQIPISKISQIPDIIKIDPNRISLSEVHLFIQAFGDTSQLTSQNDEQTPGEQKIIRRIMIQFIDRKNPDSPFANFDRIRFLLTVVNFDMFKIHEAIEERNIPYNTHMLFALLVKEIHSSLLAGRRIKNSSESISPMTPLLVNDLVSKLNLDPNIKMHAEFLSLLGQRGKSPKQIIEHLSINGFSVDKLAEKIVQEHFPYDVRKAYSPLVILPVAIELIQENLAFADYE